MLRRAQALPGSAVVSVKSGDGSDCRMLDSRKV